MADGHPAVLAVPPTLATLVDLSAVDEAQLYFPDLDDDGGLLLQAGERLLFELETNRFGVGSDRSPERHEGGEMLDLDGRCIVTSCRVVFLCEKWNSTPEMGRLASTAVEATDSLLLESAFNLVNKIKAKRERKGIMLTGQVRWPWVAGMSYAQKAGMLSFDSFIEFRCVQDKPALANAEVFLTLGLPKKINVDDHVRRIVDAIRADTLGRDHIPGDAEQRLRALQIPPAQQRKYTTIQIPGGLKRKSATATLGAHSSVALAPWREQLLNVTEKS